jgi:hypothetical protein
LIEKHYLVTLRQGFWNWSCTNRRTRSAVLMGLCNPVSSPNHVLEQAVELRWHALCNSPGRPKTPSMQATTVTSAKSELAETTQPIREDREPAIAADDPEQVLAMHSPNDNNAETGSAARPTPNTFAAPSLTVTWLSAPTKRCAAKNRPPRTLRTTP